MRTFSHQHWHILLLLILIVALYFTLETDPAFLLGELWGFSTLSWLVLAILSPIMHQLYVLLCWRYQLHHQSISKAFGTKGFKFYKIGFTLLILSRPITLVLLAISNAWTLNIDTTLSYVLSALMLLPAIYLFYSLRKYFGIDRAFGIDHFYPEKFKNTPMVNKGIFKYTANGMYVYGFLVLWLPGLLLQSKAAILVALFNHLYIWVHYYFTELPDMKVIYKKDK